MARSTTNTGSLLQATLCAVVLSLVSLHDSSAESEKLFSVVKKIDIDYRSDVSRLNTGDACYGFQPSDQLLRAAKSATGNYVKAHPEQHGV